MAALLLLFAAPAAAAEIVARDVADPDAVEVVVGDVGDRAVEALVVAGDRGRAEVPARPLGAEDLDVAVVVDTTGDAAAVRSRRANALRLVLSLPEASVVVADANGVVAPPGTRRDALEALRAVAPTADGSMDTAAAEAAEAADGLRSVVAVFGDAADAVPEQPGRAMVEVPGGPDGRPVIDRLGETLAGERVAAFDARSIGGTVTVSLPDGVEVGDVVVPAVAASPGATGDAAPGEDAETAPDAGGGVEAVEPADEDAASGSDVPWAGVTAAVVGAGLVVAAVVAWARRGSGGAPEATDGEDELITIPEEAERDDTLESAQDSSTAVAESPRPEALPATGAGASVGVAAVAAEPAAPLTGVAADVHEDVGGDVATLSAVASAGHIAELEQQQRWHAMARPGRLAAVLFVLQPAAVLAVGLLGADYRAWLTSAVGLLAVALAAVATVVAVRWILRMSTPPFDSDPHPVQQIVLDVAATLDRAAVYTAAGLEPPDAIRRAAAAHDHPPRLVDAALRVARGAESEQALLERTGRLRASLDAVVAERANRLPARALRPYLLLIVPASALLALGFFL